MLFTVILAGQSKQSDYSGITWAEKLRLPELCECCSEKNSEAILRHLQRMGLDTIEHVTLFCIKREANACF
jgi:hypothetical protein